MIIYALSDYDWERGYLVSTGPKNNKINFGGYIRAVPKEKCAKPDESVCIVWETWKGKNGRGGYRVERELYLADRLPADQVHRQPTGCGPGGRITEISYGVKQ